MTRLLVAAVLAIACVPALADPTLIERGDSMDALAESLERLDRAAVRWGHDDPRTWDAFADFAEIALVSGDAPTAAALGRALLATARAREPIDRPRLARALLLLSRVERLGDARLARELLDEALGMQASLRTADPGLWASIVEHDANMLRHDRPGKAIERYREAVRLREAGSTRSHPPLARTLTWLGWNLREQGRVDEARPVLARADAMLLELGLDRSFERAVVDGVLGSLALSTGDMPTARRRFANRDAVLDSLWRRCPAGFRRRGFTSGGPTALAYVQLAEGQPELAWNTVMGREGRVNSDFQQLAAWPELDPAGYAAVRELRLERRRFPHLLDVVASGADWPDVHEVIRLDTAIVALETDFLARHPPPSVTIRDIQVRLEDDEAYVGWLQFFFGAGHIHTTQESTDYMLGSRWLWIVRRDSFHMVEVMRDESVDGVKSQFWGADHYARRLVVAASWPTAVDEDPLVEREARRIGAQFLGGAERLLDGVNHLIVQTSLVTPTVPVEALRLADGRWLIDRYSTTYSMSASAFVRLHDAPEPAGAATDAALLVGNVSSARLPHVRGEIDALARTFEHSVALTGSDASVADLLEVADGTRRFRVAHLAGHFVTERFAERGGMALGDGEILAVHDVLNGWRLPTDLVTLSGCKSIDVRGFNSRVLPFVQALLTTGARRVVGTMFDADDEATMRLMIRFYENLHARPGGPPGGMPPREALREARVWLRDYRTDDGKQPYLHPSYWAGFGLIGAD